MQKSKKISFKWPNDIFVADKKICGIFTGSYNIYKKKFIIIGIGINIVSNPKIKGKYEATNIFPQVKKPLILMKSLNCY